jgi:hypothetical protein
MKNQVKQGRFLAGVGAGALALALATAPAFAESGADQAGTPSAVKSAPHGGAPAARSARAELEDVVAPRGRVPRASAA